MKIKYKISCIFLLVFIYFFAVYDLNFHGPDEPIYFAYTASVVEDGDLNVINQNYSYSGKFSISKMHTASGTYNLPDFHNHGGVILWAPLYAYTKYFSIIATKLKITNIASYGFVKLAKCVLSFGTIIFGFFAILFTYLLCRAFFSARICAWSIAAVFLGTPFFYYMLFETGNANIIACFFSTLSIWFCSHAIKMKKKHWFLYGIFFALCVAVKSEIWFQILFIMPFFAILTRRKQISLKNTIYFTAGFITIFLLRGMNAYLKYGALHMEEAFFVISALKYGAVYCFNGLFSSYKGILYTSPILCFCLIGFIIVLLNALKSLKNKSGEKNLSDLFFLILSSYAIIKLFIIGKIYSPAGDTLSMRILLPEFPIFVILFARFFRERSKQQLYILCSTSLLFIFWNLLVIAEHMTGLEWAYITGHPNMIKRINTLRYIFQLLLGVNNLAIKIEITWPLVLTVLGGMLYAMGKLSKFNSPSFWHEKGKALGAPLGHLVLFSSFAGIAYLVITMLNVATNKNNVESLKKEGFFKQVTIAEVSPFELTDFEKEEHLWSIFEMIRYYTTIGDGERARHIKNIRKNFFGEEECKRNHFHQPVKPFLDLTDAYTDKGGYTQAIVCYQEMIKRDPEDIDALIGLGDVYVFVGKYEKAIDVFSKAEKVNPNSLNICSRLAENYNKISDYERAIKYYQRYLQLSPNSAEVYTDLGNIYLEAGEIKEAIVVFENAIKFYPDNAEIIRTLGEIYRIKSDVDEAIKYYKRYVQLVPNSEETYQTLADLYGKKADYPRQIEYLEKVVEYRPRFLKIYTELGELYLKAADYEKAITCFKKTVQLDQNAAESYRTLGEIYRIKSDVDEAIKYYKRYVQLVPDSEETYQTLADLYGKKADYPRQIEYLEKALKLNPNSITTYRVLGELYGSKGNYQQQITYYTKITDLNPRFLEIHAELGHLYRSIGKFEEAITAFEKTIQINPAFADGYINLGELCRAVGNHDKAIEYSKKYLKFNATSPDAINVLGHLHLIKGAYNEACEYFRKTIELGYKNADAYRNLGEAYAKNKDKKNASRQVKKLLELKRNDLADELRKVIEEYASN